MRTTLSRPSIASLRWASLGLLLLVGCETLNALSSAPRPDARVTGARFRGLSLDRVDLDLDVEVDNPYSVQLPIAGLDLALKSGEHRVLSASVEPGAPIPADGQRTLDVPVSIPFLELVQAVSGLRPGETTPYQVDLTLAFDTPALGRIEVPLRHSGDLWVPALPSVQIARVGVTEASLSRVRAEIAVKVDSVNAVALPIQRFDYGLSLAGVSVARSTVDPQAELPADGAAEIVIPLELSPMSSGRALVQALSSGRVDYAVDLFVKISIDRLTIDLDY